MHKAVDNLLNIKNQLKDFGFNKKNPAPKLIAVSKNFSIQEILPLIEFGHLDFGENKVQEAINKWSNTKEQYPFIQLHMIGKLQTNKVKFVIPLFDYIHSLDSVKLAEKIAIEQQKKSRKLKIFIQVNIGNESQKNGLAVDELQDFYKKCTEELKLNIVGLMCIPPQDQQVSKHFKQMKQLNEILNLKELSMGMSEDYMEAIEYGATYVRIGSKIFGARI
jgi:pyridoxal phosphate enzyme (YggS family)